MILDFGKSWYDGIKGLTIEEFSLMSDEERNRLLHEFQNDVANELIEHFNHPAHNFGSYRVDDVSIHANGNNPFDCKLNMHSWVNGNLGYEEHIREVKVRNGFLFKLFKKSPYRIVKEKEYVSTGLSRIPALEGHVYFQRDPADPKEVFDILNFIRYGVGFQGINNWFDDAKKEAMGRYNMSGYDIDYFLYGKNLCSRDDVLYEIHKEHKRYERERFSGTF